MTTVDKCQSVLITAVVVGEMEKAVGGKGRVEGGGARALWIRVGEFARGWISGFEG